ncbi:MAG: UDP-N-acetylglucosamine 1-carboxyvinyltransferase [Chlamydiota bacterium]
MSAELLNIRGGKPLKGHLKASGAKNATTKLLVASLISHQKAVFKNVPNIGDVSITVNLCQEIGSEIAWDQEAGVIEIQTKELRTTYVPQRFSGANRIPILMLGALLGRTDHDVIVPTLGGDALGKRPVDYHIAALELLGAKIEYREMKQEGAYFARAHQGLTGTVIKFAYPSVGATENALFAAAKARGTTIIQNAALEPEVLDIILFLQKMGVSISLLKDRTIKVEETKQFYPAEHTIMPDRNEIVSYALAAVATQGNVFIEGARQHMLLSFLNPLRQIGGGYSIEENGISFFYERALRGNLHIETDVHPGFMTDWQQPFCVVLTQVEGISIIHETVYEQRFGYTKILREMGADIHLFSHCLGGGACRFSLGQHLHSAVIRGKTVLQGKKIAIPDLRAGFAYIMAALIAKDSSSITNVHYLDRGYADIEKNLANLGADIERVSSEEKVAEPTAV